MKRITETLLWIATLLFLALNCVQTHQISKSVDGIDSTLRRIETQQKKFLYVDSGYVLPDSFQEANKIEPGDSLTIESQGQMTIPRSRTYNIKINRAPIIIKE